MLCADSIVDEINSFDAKNAVIVFLSCDGKRHQSIFDADGSLTYTVTQRDLGYGEADLSVPLEMAAAGPDVLWELWTIGTADPRVPIQKNLTKFLDTLDWDSAFVVSLLALRNVNVRLSKQDQPAPVGRKRGRPAYEILNGAALCDAWPTPGTVLARYGPRPISTRAWLTTIDPE